MVLLFLFATVSMASGDPAHGEFTASDGVKIHYIEIGSGTPVILIHGYTANKESP